MSFLYFILALFACAFSAVSGAFGMRFIIERKREIAEREDPRDTRIRDLQAKIRLAANEQSHNRTTAASATEHVKLAHERIVTLLDAIQDLKNTVQSQDALRTDSQGEAQLLHDKLSVATKQLESIRQRNQELEIELSVAHEPEMLSAPQADDEIDDSEATAFEATIVDNSPSLIQSLTGELDRWKRHCHVLGDELKSHRERVSEIDEATTPDAPIADAQTTDAPTNETPTTDVKSTIPDIDELTDIRGIGAVLARKLHMLGIYRFEELANLSEDGMERAQQLIPDFHRRMKRDNWLEQARVLHENKYHQDSEDSEDNTPEYADCSALS